MRVHSVRLIGFLGMMVGVMIGWAAPPPLEAAACTPDAVPSGNLCIDRYEASVWKIPATQVRLLRLVKLGRATFAALTSPMAIANGVVQLGLAGGDLAAAGCPVTGNGCTNVYAVSIPGVTPSSFLTWFQAAAAARNAGKRLPSNAEWQAAALGTPDTGGADDGATTCNTDSTLAVAATGSRSACVSDVGAFDMVGNLWEWVADWTPLSAACPGWGGFSDDHMCLAGASTTDGPGALVRGGRWALGANAGVFAVSGDLTPSDASSSIGFRAAR